MLTLTPISESDLAAVQKYVSAPEIAVMSNVPSPYPDDGALIWYASVVFRVAQGRAAVFAIKDESDFHGVMSINDINHDTGTAQLDYWVGVPFQGRGIATRAAAIAIDHATQTLALRKLLSSCLTANVASARVLERNGFAELERMIIPEGRYAQQELRRFQRQLLPG